MSNYFELLCLFKSVMVCGCNDACPHHVWERLFQSLKMKLLLRRLVPPNCRRRRELHVTVQGQKIERREESNWDRPIDFYGSLQFLLSRGSYYSLTTGHVILATDQGPERTCSTVPWSDLMRFETSSSNGAFKIYFMCQQHPEHITPQNR